MNIQLSKGPYKKIEIDLGPRLFHEKYTLKIKSHVISKALYQYYQQYITAGIVSLLDLLNNIRIKRY